MKPTDEQKQKFWEWCGFYQQESQSGQSNWWTSTSRTPMRLPPIDPNNLLKYAAPKLTGYVVSIYPQKLNPTDNEVTYPVTLGLSSGDDYVMRESKDPALALFWAIYKVMEASNED